MELVPGLLQYLTEAVRRIERKVEIIEINQSDVARQLSDMKRKQEMVLTKQDQIQSTLHGDTAVFQSPASSVFAGGATPPLTSPTSTFPQLSCPEPRPVVASPSGVSDSDITSDSVLDDCDLESLFGLDPFPPVNLKPVAEPAVNIQSEAGHSSNVAREKGPLTEFLTTGVPPHIDSAGLMHLGAVAELLQSLSAGKSTAPLGTGVSTECQQDQTAGVQPAAVLSQSQLEPTQPQTAASSQPGPSQVGTSGGLPQLGTAAGSLQPGTPVRTPQLGTSPGPPQLGTSAGTPQLGTAAGQLQLGTTIGTSQLGTTVAPPQLGTATEPPQVGTSVGTPQLGTAIKPPELGTTARPLQLGVTVGPPHTLQDPSVVMSLLEFKIVDATNVGKFARALASRVVFGDDILRQSTFKGDSRRGLDMLDRGKLSQLFTLIHRHPSFADWSKTDFDTLVKKKIIPSISHLCKELRR